MMIRDHTRIWLLRPGFTLEQFGELPSYLDETDERPAVEQFGKRWCPIDELFWLDGSALHSNGGVHEVLGAIHLRHELVMVFEDELVAVVQSDRSMEVSRITLRDYLQGNARCSARAAIVPAAR
jgi:hypothetical protein